MNDYCTILALEDGVYFSINTVSEYCIDGGEFTILPSHESSVTINSGQSFSIKARLFSNSMGIHNMFTIHGKCELIGNVMSLLTGDTGKGLKSLEEYGNALSMLFYGCTSIQSVSKDFLPATTLAGFCYESMFYGCTSLTTAPALPATTLTANCYDHMFYGCTSLVNAPELPATTLALQCYDAMFKGCTNLNYIKMLATDISASYCLYDWVNGVASTGTFVKNSAMTSLPTAKLSNYYAGIPSGWTVQNA